MCGLNCFWDLCGAFIIYTLETVEESLLIQILRISPTFFSHLVFLFNFLLYLNFARNFIKKWFGLPVTVATPLSPFQSKTDNGNS